MNVKKNTILVVDKEPQTYKILDIVLDGAQFDVVPCESGKQAISLCVSMKPDIMILDLDLPDMSSGEIIKSIREWSHVPFIIVAASEKNNDIITSLNSGADDYVTKPFNADVLRARINASLRKSAILETGEPELTNGPLRIDLVRHQVFLDDEMIAFTPKEYNLLRYFIVNCGKMLSHRQILHEVWGAAHSDDIQYLRVFIGQIREKIEANPTIPVIITTELGIGYRMEFLEDVNFHRQGEMIV